MQAKRAGDAFNVVFLILFALAATAVIALSGGRTTFSQCLVFACVCTCAATDLSSGYIYDVVTYPSMVMMVLASLHAGTLNSTAAWTCLSFACVALLVVVTRGRGLGFGDVKLFAVVGAGLGGSVIGVLGGSFVVGACLVVVGLLRGRIRFGQTVPFAPFIAIATILSVPFERLFA